jgi:hypothetical protein
LNPEAQSIDNENPLYIPQGEESVDLWYYSTEANGYIDWEYGWEYYDEWVGVYFAIEGDYWWDWVYLRVAPGEATKIVAYMEEARYFDALRILGVDGYDHWDIVLPRSGAPGDEWDQDPGNPVVNPGMYHIKPNSQYEVHIGLLDEYGNPTVANTEPINVQLNPNDKIAFYRESWDTYTIGDIELDGTLWNTIYLAYPTENYEEDQVTVHFDAINMEGASFNLVVQSSAKGLAVYLANINNPVKYLGDYGDYWWVNEAWGWNDTEIPCIVAVIDDKGRPIEWNGPDDLRVTLTASEGGFYTDDYSVSAPEGSVEITIPKGYTGVELYYLRSQPSANPQENDLLTAQDQSGILQPGTTEVKLFPRWVMLLTSGWNVVSTPVALERPRFDQFISDLSIELVDPETLSASLRLPFTQEAVEIAYSFDPVDKTWHQIYQVPDGNLNAGKWVVQEGETPNYSNDPVFLFKPMDAVYVKIKDSKDPYDGAVAVCYPASTPTGPYESNLQPGWNLVGPALDLSKHPSFYTGKPIQEPVTRFINSVYNECIQVVNPAFGLNLEPWNYIPGEEWNLDEIPQVTAGSGVWMYMANEAKLAGFSYTPVENLF